MTRLAMFCFIAACSAPPHRPQLTHQSAPSVRAATVIDSGNGIGPVSLGDRVATVRAALGPPSHEVRGADVTAMVWFEEIAPNADGYTVTQTGFAPLHETFVALVVNDRVVQLEVSAPRYHTATGISTATTVTALRRVLPTYTTIDADHVSNPDPSASTPASKHFLAFDDASAAGLSIKYGAWGNLAPDPDVDAPPEAIVVHRPGAAPLIDPIDALPYAGHSDASYAF